jgi:hypothetical protein
MATMISPSFSKAARLSFANRRGDGTIESLGGFNGFSGSGDQWKLQVGEIIGLIDSGRWSFFVSRPTSSPPDRVKVVLAPNGLFLK